MVGNAPPRMWLFTKGESNRWVPLVILPHRGILLFSPLFLRSDVFAALPSCQCGSMSRAYSTVTEWNSYSSHIRRGSLCAMSGGCAAIFRHFSKFYKIL